MSVKTIAIALAISVGASSLALAQTTVTNPPSGSLGMNNSQSTTGTINAPRPGSTTIQTEGGSSPASNIATSGTDDSNRKMVSPMTHKTTSHKKMTKKHTAQTVKSMSNGTSGNASTPNTQLHGNNGG